MTDKQSFNITGLDDMEYVDLYGLDPAVAYTPAINDAILDAQRTLNQQGYQSDGKSEKEAAAMAQEDFKRASHTVKKNLAKRK